MLFYQRVTMSFQLDLNTQSAVLCWLTEPAFKQLQKKWTGFVWNTKEDVCKATFFGPCGCQELADDIAGSLARERIRYFMEEKIQTANPRHRLFHLLCAKYPGLSSRCSGSRVWWMEEDGPFTFADWTDVEQMIVRFWQSDKPADTAIPDEYKAKKKDDSKEFTTDRLGRLLANYAKADDLHRHLTSGWIGMDTSEPEVFSKKAFALFQKGAFDQLVVVDNILKDNIPCGMPLADLLLTRQQPLTLAAIEVLVGILQIPNWDYRQQPWYERDCAKAWTNATPQQKQVAIAFLAALPVAKPK